MKPSPSDPPVRASAARSSESVTPFPSSPPSFVLHPPNLFFHTPLLARCSSLPHPEPKKKNKTILNILKGRAWSILFHSHSNHVNHVNHHMTGRGDIFGDEADQLWDRLVSYKTSGFLLGASVDSSNETTCERVGLVSNHAYSVMDLR